MHTQFNLPKPTRNFTQYLSNSAPFKFTTKYKYTHLQETDQIGTSDDFTINELIELQ